VQQTPNYGLNKYETNDTADLTQINPNMDTIDQELKANSDALTTHEIATDPHSQYITTTELDGSLAEIQMILSMGGMV
jgi:hypothetical protein